MIVSSIKQNDLPSMKIYVSPVCRPLGDRIQLSSGTRAAEGDEVGDGRYEEGARLPREPWRLPTKQEAEVLFLQQPPLDTTQSICFIRSPKELSDESREAIRTHDDKGIYAGVVRPLQAICDFGGPLTYIGKTTHAPNLLTVTVNNELRRYIGLHVDNWDHADPENLAQASNRICLNVGEADRYFLFIPHSVAAIVTLLKEKVDGWVVPGRHTLIARQFMQMFPEVPVVRCCLAPGEAYIAPTENMIHDASSVGQQAIDEPFTILGHIKIKSTQTGRQRQAWTEALARVCNRALERARAAIATTRQAR